MAGYLQFLGQTLVFAKDHAKQCVMSFFGFALSVMVGAGLQKLPSGG